MTSAREFDINLIEGRKALPRGGGRSLAVTIGTGVLIALLLVIAGWLLLDRRLETVKKNLASAETEQRLRQEEVDKLQASDVALSDLTRHVMLADQVLKTVPSWTKLFQRLERATLSKITVESLAADRLGMIRLSGQAANLPQLMDQVKLWQEQSFIKKVEVGGLTRDAGEQSVGAYRFFAVLELAPEALYGR